MALHQHLSFQKYEPEQLLEVVRGGYTEHSLPVPGACTGELWRWEHPLVCVDSGRYQFEAAVRGTFRPGYVCFGLVQALERNTEINGADVGRGDLQVYPEGLEFCYHGEPGTHWIAIQIHREEIQRAALASLGRTLAIDSRRWSNLKILPGAHAALLGLVRAAMRQSELVPGGEHRGQTDDVLAEAIVEAVIDCLDLAQRDAAFDEQQIRAYARVELVARAMEYLRTGPLTAYDSARVCDTLGVPERTLQLAFRRTMGMTPRGWYAEFRLRRAHGMLLQASPAETVTAVAHRVGFDHLGRFSGAYKQLFGRAPSETLRPSR